MSNDLFAAGVRLRDLGLRVYPVGAGKKPIGRWKSYVTAAPADDAQLSKWVADPRVQGWAVLCGNHGDGIACVDVEAAGTAVPDIAAAVQATPSYARYRSRNGGVHVWLDVADGPVITEELAKRDTGLVDEHGEPVFDLLAEVRGVSKSPDNAGAYAVVVGPGRPPLAADFRPWRASDEELAALIARIRAHDQHRAWKAARDARKAAARPPRPTVTVAGESTGDLITAAVASGELDVLAVLPDGWERVGIAEGRELIRRPGATSPDSGNVRDGIYVIHSTAVGWAEPGEAIPASKVLAEARHGGDYAAAMAAVEAAAAGEPSPYAGWSPNLLGRVQGARQAQLERWKADQDRQVREWIPDLDHDELDVQQDDLDHQDDGERRWWEDLGWMLTGPPPEPPEGRWCTRNDGVRLFYAERANVIYGDPETGKSWVALAACAEALQAGERVAILDADGNGAPAIAGRLRALGVPVDVLADPEHFRYVSVNDRDDIEAALDGLHTWHPAVLILDSLGELLPLLGVKQDDNDAISIAQRELTASARTSGACVIILDHLPKNTEANRSFAIGGIAKKRPMRGSQVRATKVAELAPGKVGKVGLTVEKDSTGGVRQHCQDRRFGTFILDATDPQAITWEIITADDRSQTGDGSQWEPTALMERVSRWLEAHPGEHSRTVVGTEVTGKKNYILAALDALERHGNVGVREEVRGSKSLRYYRHSRAYREADSTAEEGPDSPIGPIGPGWVPDRSRDRSTTTDPIGPIGPTPIGGTGTGPVWKENTPPTASGPVPASEDPDPALPWHLEVTT